MIGLIALYSSYDHINVFGRVISLNKQQGVWFIAASLAVVFVEFVQYSAPLGHDAQLASRSRLRAENEAAEARDRGARQAQLAYLAQPSVANREQLEQVLSKLSRPEVRALFEDEALEKALGLRP